MGPAVVLALLLAGGCGDDGSPPPPPDRGADAGGPDGGRTDAGGGGAADAADAAEPSSAGPWFEDRTEAAGLAFERVPANGWDSLPDRISGGVCVLDADGMPPLDLFFALRPGDAGGSRLYVARGALDYVEETSARGLAAAGDAIGCLAFDAEGDGDDDLLVTGVGAVQLFENDGGSFVDRSDRLAVTLAPGDMMTTAAAGDLDADGDLDLVVAGYVRWDPSVIPSEGCTVGGCALDLVLFERLPDLLLVRESDGSYRERSATLAPDLRRAEPTLVVTVSDLDEDGDPDIWVGNDLGLRYVDRPLVRDAGGVYRDASDVLGLSTNRRGLGIWSMAHTHGDVDGDGRLDHAVTSFEDDATALFLCPSTGRCEDGSLAWGTDAAADSFRWGAALVDLDLDGRPDLIEATGHLVTDAEALRIGARGRQSQRPNLYHNLLGRRFRLVEPEPGDGLDGDHAARGLAVADLDDDGRPDVVLAPSIGRPVLLHNVRESDGHWLRVVLRGAGPNRGAVGARVEVTGSAGPIVRERTAGEGYLGSFDPRLLFGLPDGGPVDVEVRWPGGAVSRLHGVEVDRELVIVQP